MYTDELYPTYPRYQGSSPTKALSQYGLTATLALRYQFQEVIPPYQATALMSVSSHDLFLSVKLGREVE